MKKLCLLILIALVTLSKSYGNCSPQKADTGNRFIASVFDYNLSLGMKKIKRVKQRSGLLQKQSSIGLITKCQNDGFSAARLIRSDWDDDIFNRSFAGQKQVIIAVFPVGYTYLTDDDRQNFVLSTESGTVKQWKDTVCYYNNVMRNCLSTLVPVKLTNKSADTLRYYNMSCSWLDIFTVDGEGVSILSNNICYKNNALVYKVPPHEAVTFYIPVCVITDTGSKNLFNSKSFKIGIGLYKYIAGSHARVDLRLAPRRSQPGNIIWSDEIAIR